MKILILMLALLIAAPPVQAGLCDMDHDQEASQNKEMSHHGQDNNGHDCCESDDKESAHFCDNAIDCNNCSSALFAVTAINAKAFPWSRVSHCSLADSRLASSHSSPPFRPPIS